MISMTSTITGMSRSYGAGAREVRRDRMRQAMEDSLQIIMQSTLMGYVKRQAPDGTPWRANAQWYAEMKGQDSPNTGPVSKTIQGGPFAKTHEFESVNIKRMKNSLMKTNSVTRGVVEYEQQARERAQITQFGGRSEFAIVTKQGFGQGRLAFDVNCIERPHLGVATFPRIGFRTDAEWVEFYFGEQVEIDLQDQMG
jgi:hypothetical protein